MQNRLTFLYSPGAKLLVRFLPIALLAFSLAGCSGVSSKSDITPVVPPGGIKANNFGMQCGNGDTQDCEGSSPANIVWPSSQAQPGMLRLHDSYTYWSTLNPSSGTYDWTYLDAWLDLIAQHQPVSVMEVFTWTPCWDTNTTGSQCGIDPTAPTGSNGVPNDLTPTGSSSFNTFVTAFVRHCSAAGNCVGNCPAGTTCNTSNLIQYYEMWNEWDLTFHWVGSMAQVYQMIAPATTIIKQNVSNAVILTPSATKESPTWQCDLLNWLNYETANGVVSDWIAWHVYLSENANTDVIPEAQWSNYGKGFLAVQQGQSVSGCSSGSTAPGWSSTPWANTETNFNGATTSTYSCPSSQYNAQDCVGQIIRWQIMHDSNGASSLDWYKWNETIGTNPQLEPAYYWMMQKFVGGKFTGAASSTVSGASAVWSAPFSESDGTSAMFVWTTSETGATYSVPTGFSNYLDLAGNMTSVSSGSSVNVTTEPILLEQ